MKSKNEQVELIIAPEDSWPRYFKDYPLGPWMGFSVDEDGTPFIQLREDSYEDDIEEALNHEMIHRMLCILEGKETSFAFDSPRVETFIGKQAQVRVS